MTHGASELEQSGGMMHDRIITDAAFAVALFCAPGFLAMAYAFYTAFLRDEPRKRVRPAVRWVSLASANAMLAAGTIGGIAYENISLADLWKAGGLYWAIGGILGQFVGTYIWLTMLWPLINVFMIPYIARANRLDRQDELVENVLA